MSGLLDEFVPKNPLMAKAWVDCLRWSITEPRFLDAFLKESGITWTPANSPLEQLIDQATGLEESIVRQYIGWFNTHVWGQESPYKKEL